MSQNGIFALVKLKLVALACTLACKNVLGLNFIFGHSYYRLVLSNPGKNVMRRYLKYVRPKAPKSPVDDEVFFNTEGKPLNSSSVSEHLEVLQREAGYTGMYRS